MSRAVWKGPFVEESLIKKVDKLKNETNKKPIKTWSRKSTIIPDFVGISFLIYNGKKLCCASSSSGSQSDRLIRSFLSAPIDVSMTHYFSIFFMALLLP